MGKIVGWKRIGVSFMMLALIFTSSILTTVEASDVNVRKELEQHLKEEVNYFKANTINILAAEKSEVIVEKPREDKTVFEEKKAAFEQEMAKEQKLLLEQGLKEAQTLKDIQKVKDEAAGILKEKQEKFNEENEKYIDTVIEKETYNIVLISANYKTVKSNIFTYNHHSFYYYDMDKGEFIIPDNIRASEQVKAFEERNKEHTKTKKDWRNTVYLFIFLSIVCVFPVIAGSTKKHLSIHA